MRTITLMKAHIRTVVAIMKAQRSVSDKVIFGVSVILFFVLTLVPGLTGSYAEAQYDGGGGGASCFICDDWVDSGTGKVVHKDYYLFTNDQHGAYHSSTVVGGCSQHAIYIQS